MSKLIKKIWLNVKSSVRKVIPLLVDELNARVIQSYCSLEPEMELRNRTGLQLQLHKMLHELPTMICEWNLVNCVSV